MQIISRLRSKWLSYQIDRRYRRLYDLTTILNEYPADSIDVLIEMDRLRAKNGRDLVRLSNITQRDLSNGKQNLRT